MSKILKFTLISLFVVISVFSVKTETVQAKSNSVYEYNISDGEVYITNYKGSDIHVDIPSKIDGKPVVSIESECFNKSKIKTIYIPDSVREIHSDAFKECSA